MNGFYSDKPQHCSWSTLIFAVINQLTYIYTHFEPDYVRTNVKTFTSCEPGFGIREIFCSACPLHHFSPNKSAECFKCPSGFHQPVAGSKKCVKCPNIFVAGCKITVYVFHMFSVLKFQKKNYNNFREKSNVHTIIISFFFIYLYNWYDNWYGHIKKKKIHFRVKVFRLRKVT